MSASCTLRLVRGLPSCPPCPSAAHLAPKPLCSHLSHSLCEDNMTAEADCEGCLHSASGDLLVKAALQCAETGAPHCVMLQACKQWVPVSERTLWESVDSPPWTGSQQTLPTPTAVSGTSSQWQDTHKDHKSRQHFCNLILSISEWSLMPMLGLECKCLAGRSPLCNLGMPSKCRHVSSACLCTGALQEPLRQITRY